MLNLQQALQNSKIGNNYTLLGERKSCFSKKTYLSYDNGWKVIHLNIFQCFLRKIFGGYESTHLKPVLKKLSQEDLPLGLIHRMEELWQHSHSETSPLIKKYEKNLAPSKKQNSLFGHQSNIGKLAAYYNDESPIFNGLIRLQEDYRYHRIPGDGHCLFRSLGAGVLLAVNKDSKPDFTEHLELALDTINASNDLREAYNDFKDYLSLSPRDVLRNKYSSDRIVQFLRLLACEYNGASNHFRRFLPEGQRPGAYLHQMKSMSRREMGGHIEIQALAECLGIGIHILDVDGIGKGDHPENEHYWHLGSEQLFDVHLLYTPLHYNLAVVAEK